MTKKHYEAIADVVCRINLEYSGNTTIHKYVRTSNRVTARRLADYFATDNPRFDRDKFLTACGIEGEKPCHWCGYITHLKDGHCGTCDNMK